MNISTKRIQAELRKVQNSKIDDISLDLFSDNDFTHLKGSFSGFENTPYEGGKYEIDIKIPEDFPFKPPKLTFKTHVWHPNVSSATGYICLDLLKEGQWAPAVSLINVLTSIKTLLILAQPDDPQDAMVAAQYMRDQKCFEKTASFWNYEYAGGPYKEEFYQFEEKIKFVMKTGLDRDSSIHHLSMTDWKVDHV